MKKLLFVLWIFQACTLEVPVDEIEVPPVENNTTIVIELPDGLSLPIPVGHPDADTACQKEEN